MLISKQNNSNANDLILAQNLHSEYPALLKAAQVKWILNNRQDNGLDNYQAVIKVSNRLYVKKSAFFEWFTNHSSN